MTSLPLSKALSQLRNELRDAQLSSDPNLKLNVSAIQLDLAIEAETKIEAGVEVSVWSVLTGKARAEHGSMHTHRLSLTIEPKELDSEGNVGDLRVGSPPLPDRD
jgi:hypothetical protein